MRQVLRSLVAMNPLDNADITENFSNVKLDYFQNLNKSQRELLSFILDFHIDNRVCPSYDTVHQHSLLNLGVEATVYLEELKEEKPLIGADFEYRLRQEYELQRRYYLQNQMTEATAMLKTRSASEVLNFLHTSLMLADSNDHIPIHMRDAESVLLQQVNERRANYNTKTGVLYTGYKVFDECTGGLRKGHLYLHAGFVNHMKSTFMLNVIVNMAVDYGLNSILFTSEMPYDDIMFTLTCIHSGNPKFLENHKVTGYKPLNAFNLITGNCSQAEIQQFKEMYRDLTQNPAYGSIRVMDTSKFRTWGDIKSITIRQHNQERIDVMWVDYLTRLPVETSGQGFNEVQSRNELIVDAKRFALSFDNGEGLLVCSPFQINRQGYLKAKQSGGKFDLTCMAQYNASEKEADSITYIYYDEEETAINQPKVGLLKNRWGKKTYEIEALYIDPGSRRIYPRTVLPNGAVLDHFGNVITTDAPTGLADATPEIKEAQEELNAVQTLGDLHTYEYSAEDIHVDTPKDHEQNGSGVSGEGQETGVEVSST